jgi:hypothetical protein
MFGSGDIRAWTFASETGYSFPELPWKPRLSVKSDISSGDDPPGRALGTFDALFPIGNYFGVLADTGPGPQNFIDVHPKLQIQPVTGVSVSMDLVALWRESLRDGVYAVPGFLLVPAGTSRARFVGFFLGAIGGGRISVEQARRAFAVEAILLIAAAAIAFRPDLRSGPTRIAIYGIIATTAIAMGMRNAMVRKLAVPDLTTTVLTLTITGLAADSSLAHGGNPRWQRRCASVLMMLTGAAAGATLLRRSVALTLGIAAAATAACVFAAYRAHRKDAN